VLRYRADASADERATLRRLVAAGQLAVTGGYRLMTLAPELARAHELVDLCLDHGVRASVGHTEASFEQVPEAASWGVRHLSHTLNAMPPLHHRAPGPAGAAIMLPELLAEIIADNHHVHPALLRTFLRAKGTHGLVLITDALRPTGLGDDVEVLIGGRPARVQDGLVRLADGTIAGSVLTMDRAPRNLAAADGRPRPASRKPRKQPASRTGRACWPPASTPTWSCWTATARCNWPSSPGGSLTAAS